MCDNYLKSNKLYNRSTMRYRSPDYLQSESDGSGLPRKTAGLNSFSELLTGEEGKAQVFIRVNVKYAWSHHPQKPLSHGFYQDSFIPTKHQVSLGDLSSPNWVFNGHCSCRNMYQRFFSGSFNTKAPGCRLGHLVSPASDVYFQPRAQQCQNPLIQKASDFASLHDSFQNAHKICNCRLLTGPLGEVSVGQEEVTKPANKPSLNQEGLVISHVIDPEQPNLSKLKEAISHYFFDPDQLSDNHTFSHLETQLIKVMLIKKLVHDKKKSKIFYAIRNLSECDVAKFMLVNPAINRKNIIKSNIFKRAWKLLEKRHKANFNEYFFEEFMDTMSSDFFSIKVYRKDHCFNLADEFYCRCFVSNRFRTEFFEALQDEAFRDSVLRQSKHKFLNSFDYWMNETVMFLRKCPSPFERTTRLPDFKYGMSAKDFEIAPSLFLRLISKD